MKINSEVLRVYKCVHTWVGICSALFLFIGFYAGSLTMFKEPIDRWLSPPQAQLRMLDNPAEIDALFDQVVHNHPEALDEFTLHLDQAENVAAPIVWSAGKLGRLLTLDAKSWLATLDHNGQLYTELVQPTVVAELIDRLHRTAGIPFVAAGESLGIYIMGGASLLYFLALVSGLILLLPTLVKDFFALRLGSNNKRFWLDSHNIVGITSLPFHLIIAYTAIVFAFHDIFYDGLSAIVYGDVDMFGPRSVSTDVFAIGDLLSPSEIIAIVKTQAPAFDVRELLFMGLDGPRPMVRAGIANSDYLVTGPHTAYMRINPFSGAITGTDGVPGKGNIWGAIVSVNFALHFGSYGGNLVRWMYFLMGLSGAFLFYSGNLLWVESRRKKARRGKSAGAQQNNTQWIASLTVGVCLGSVGAVIITLVAVKWLYLVADNINYTCFVIYYIVFFASILWAIVRGAPAASVDLLYLCGMASAAIPVTTILGFVIPFVFWANTSLASLSVDFVATVFSMVFIATAKLVIHRKHNGNIDSVWSDTGDRVTG